MHYYNFHIGDYKSHTHHLSLMEDLAYRRLLDFYYLHESPIKQRDIARQIGMKDFEQEVLTVLDEFFISTENGYIHTRADDEISKYRKFTEDGKKGAAIRWAKAGYSPPNATPIATNNHKPITNNHIYTPIGVSDSVFQEFKSLRKAKKAPITERAIDGIRTEAEKAGWTLEQAMTECLVRGWTGFKAEWVVKPNVADKVHQTVPSKFERDPTFVALDESIKNAKTNPEMIAKIREALKGKVA